MEARAYLRYTRISPRKVQIVLDLIRNQPVEYAMATLKHTLDNHNKIVEENNTKNIKNFKYLEEIFSDFKIYDFPMQKDTNLHS